MNPSINIQHHLHQVSHVVAHLLEKGLRVEQIRIQGRAQPAVCLRNTGRTAQLNGSRYAWGLDEQGRFERYAALIDGVQVQWEVRQAAQQRPILNFRSASAMAYDF